MNATDPNILGAHARVAAAPKAPPLTIQSVYLQGDPEVVWAGCSWSAGPKTKPQLVHFPIADLVAA
ncbi:MAG: hypothetical protein ABUR63_00340 [Verrucomicrobiota bacterium]